MVKKEKMEKKDKKNYVKPLAQKHKAVSLISGSGCNSYSSRSSGTVYYH
jgi:hypothetical protein